MMLKRLIGSFKDAGHGLRYAFSREQNFRLQIFVAFIVLVCMVVFPLKNWEIILLILLVMMVLTMELLNTAMEQFSDLLKPRLHDYVFVIKDIMAAAVLITSIGSGIVGLIILLPYFLSWWK